MTVGTLFAFIGYLVELLRSRPAALAALQHVPLGGRGARQDHGRARRGAGGRRPARRGRAAAHRGARRASRTCASATARAPRCCTASTSTCPPGTTVALVGHTGAGKSTIAKLLARFYEPARRAGSRSTATTCSDVTQASLRRQLGVVPQEGFLFAGTVRDNIAFGQARRERRGRSSARRRRSARTTSSSPRGRLRDATCRSAARASRSGQRQLVAFARALLADPRILILDEATSSVDIGTERKIERALCGCCSSGRTAFIIAHRLSTIRGADLIVVLEHGRIVEQGSHDELLARRGLYTSLYGDWAAQVA